MFLTEYLFTPSDIMQAVKSIKAKASRRDVTRTVLLLIFAAGLWWQQWPLTYIAFTLVLCSVLLWRLDARLPLGAGIACLVGIMLLQALFQAHIMPQAQDYSQVVAVWAFFFLAIGVIKQTIDLLVEQKGS